MGSFSIMPPIALLFAMFKLARKEEKFLPPTLRTTQSTFVLLPSAREALLSLSTWISIPEVLISGVQSCNS
jgi:hypothetical protein